MAQPLTDAITALTRYANETTGQSDQTLSDAVRTLCDGYGGGGAPILPNEYARLLCLTSSLTQYIDTGLITKANSTFYLQFAKATNGTQNFFGNNFSNCASFIQLGTNNTDMYYQFGSVAYSHFTVQLASNEVFSLKLNANGIYGKNDVTGEYDLIASIEGTTVTENSSATNLLFARRRNGNSPQTSQVTFYRFIAEEGGEKVRDMYPAMRKADGELGMYDVVNDVFYTNQGTGTFIKGAMI